MVARDDDEGQDVRQHMAEHDAQVARACRLDRLHEWPMAYLDNRGAVDRGPRARSGRKPSDSNIASTMLVFVRRAMPRIVIRTSNPGIARSASMKRPTSISPTVAHRPWRRRAPQRARRS